MKYFYSYNEFVEDIDNLTKQLKEFEPDAIIPLARGGLTMGHFLGERLKIRDVCAVNTIHYNGDKKLDTLKVFNLPDLKRFKKVVIVDDISDSGDSLEGVLKVIKNSYPDLIVKVATIFYKKTSKVIPDFKIKENKRWIVFFWEDEFE